MVTTKLFVYKNGVDVSEDLEQKNFKALPTGWSQVEIWHDGKRIGWLESGYPMDFIEGYKAEVQPL